MRGGREWGRPAHDTVMRFKVPVPQALYSLAHARAGSFQYDGTIDPIPENRIVQNWSSPR